jgi:hypothetical protein
MPRRVRIVEPFQRLASKFILEVSQDLLVPRLLLFRRAVSELLASRIRLTPLMLFFVELLEIGERVFVTGIEPEYF